MPDGVDLGVDLGGDPGVDLSVDPGVDLHEVGYDDPDVVALVEEVQQEYVIRYGGRDTTPLDPSMFVPPQGRYVVVHVDGEPVAMGGWRRHDEARDGPVPGARAAEIKRMYVTPRARGRGLARALLADLERSAGAAGCDLMVLESGLAQPEALALYRSAGYHDIAPFGHYPDSDQSVHLAKPLRPPVST